MKKTELKDCPQWLLLADTISEDVIIDNTGCLIWLGGEFLGGEFLGGSFLGGEFLGGSFGIINKWSFSFISNGKMKIGCKLESLEFWDKWFEGNEEFETKRGTAEFGKIKAQYILCKSYLQFLRDFEPNSPLIKSLF